MQVNFLLGTEDLSFCQNLANKIVGTKNVANIGEKSGQLAKHAQRASQCPA